MYIFSTYIKCYIIKLIHYKVVYCRITKYITKCPQGTHERKTYILFSVKTRCEAQVKVVLGEPSCSWCPVKVTVAANTQPFAIDFHNNTPLTVYITLPGGHTEKISFPKKLCHPAWHLLLLFMHMVSDLITLHWTNIQWLCLWERLSLPLSEVFWRGEELWQFLPSMLLWYYHCEIMFMQTFLWETASQQIFWYSNFWVLLDFCLFCFALNL